MIDFSKIPRNADDALFYLVGILSSEFEEFFDSKGGIKNDLFMKFMTIVNAIKASAEKASFDEDKIVTVNAESIISHLNKYELNIARARIFIGRIEGEIVREKLTRRFSIGHTEPLFALEKDGAERILNLSAEMRDLIISSNVLDDNHKNRLLNRLSSLEIEVLNPEGRYDVVLGGIVDFGETLGTFGDKIKPLVDRMCEIKNIARKASKDYDTLPAPDEQKRLPAPKDE